MSELKAFRIIQGDTGGYGAPSYKCNTDGDRIEEWSDACEVYDRFEADNVIADKDAEIAQLQAMLEERNKQVGELKEERRWRKFSEEKPSEEMEGEDFLVSNGYYSVVCEWRGYWNNEPFCGDKNCDVVKYWMPLPSAPKEDK